MSPSEVLVVLAIVFLGLHLMTDARRMVLVLLRGHTLAPLSCPRCGAVADTLKEAWWEVLTFIVLVGHITLDYI